MRQIVDGSGAVVIYQAYEPYVTETATGPSGTSEFSACSAAATVLPGSVNATYIYDGDRTMVKSVVNGVTTYYAGAYQLEINGSDTIERKYYSAAGMRIAMRTQVNGGEETLNWLIRDHLSSTSMTTDADGVVVSEVKYSAFGEIRYQDGVTPTDYLYNGQRQEAELGLYYYVARWYDPALGCFIQADTIIPDPASAKAYDRFVYALNNPVKYNDPSGHSLEDRGICPDGDCSVFEPLEEEVNCIVCGLDIDLQYPALGPGLPCNESMPGWVGYIDDEYEFRYQECGKQATIDYIVDQNKFSSDSILSVIGFSGGADASLMLTIQLVENGIIPENLVLLGPTFEATVDIENNIVRKGFSAWQPYIDILVNNGVNVLVIGDSTITNSAVTPNYSGIGDYEKPVGATGTFTYRKFPSLQHSTQTNKLDPFIKWVLAGLENPALWETGNFP